MSMAEDLGKLVIAFNPYSQQMDIYVGNPNPGQGGIANNYRQVEIEDENAYAGDWTFNNVPQRIARAIRIKYRYPRDSKDETGATFTTWVTEHVLIGYAGDGGGG